MTSPLEGWRVVVTRERPGELAAKLTERGAMVIHVPLIAAAEPSDGGAALRESLAGLAAFDWLIVTSPAGAERVADAAIAAPGVRLAAVGTATARVLERRIGRPVDLVPSVQRAEALAEAFVDQASSPQRVLIAHADIAASTVADALRRAGHEVIDVVAYRTIAVEPDRAAVVDADAVLFASGSSVESWCRAFGTATPPIVVAIGPMTAAVAEQFGLKVSAVSADHSLDGLVAELERVCADAGSATREQAPCPK
jgi:uroporphyrinogen-III synthase